MELVKTFIDLFLHLDKHLTQVVQDYGTWTYALLFAIVFCETGLVVTPILPGDSLLFAGGALAALGALDLWLLSLLIAVAAVLGDMVNYWAGHYFGARIFKPNARFLKTEYLERTQEFYARYGGKTIVMCRFVPIIRTFAPFVAGMGSMQYRRFFIYNVTGAIAWVLVCVGAGYFFGNIPVVKKNFSLVVLAIIFISILPGIIGVIRARRAGAAKANAAGAPPPAAGSARG
jgi:membrane-associated protein